MSDIAFNLTRDCNFTCPHCYLQRRREYLSFKRVVEGLVVARGKTATFTGGEPLLHKDLFPLIRIANDLGYKVNLLTNGSLLDEAKVSALSRFNVEVFISFNGENKRALRAIKIVLAHEIPVSSHTVYTTDVVTKLDEIISKLDSVRPFFLYPTAIGSSNVQCVPPKDWNKRIKLLHDITSQTGKEIFYEPAFAKRQAHLPLDILCPAGKDIFMDSDGKCYACCLMTVASEGMDSILPTKAGFKKCKFCLGGCPALNRTYGHDPRCNGEFVPICPVIVTSTKQFKPVFPSHLER